MGKRRRGLLTEAEFMGLFYDVRATFGDLIRVTPCASPSPDGATCYARAGGASALPGALVFERFRLLCMSCKARALLEQFNRAIDEAERHRATGQLDRPR